MSQVTQNITDFVFANETNLADMSRKTGISYMDIYNSLANRKRGRDLKDWEFLRICQYLGADPMVFDETTKKPEEALSPLTLC